MANKARVYVSFDIEADGPSPAANNMIALGVVVVREGGNPYHKQADAAWLVEKCAFYFAPSEGRTASGQTMTEFWCQHKSALELIEKQARDAKVVTREFYDWFCAIRDKYEVVEWIAYPAAFDWQWIKYYVHRFIGEEAARNIGYSALCIDSIEETLKRIGVSIEQHSNLLHSYPATHNPMDDALSQAVRFLIMQMELVRIKENCSPGSSTMCAL